MNTLQYYEQYRTLCGQAALLQGQLQFGGGADEALLLRLESIEREKREIEDSLTRYVPYPLAARPYYRALEEQEFLFYRCIKGLTMKQTAQLMCVSRDTVYRIRRRIAKGEGRCASTDPS